MQQLLRYGLTATAAAALLGGVAWAGDVNLPQAEPGQGQLAVGVGVICNTSEQAEHYIRLRADGEEA